ncbi:FAD-dependent monooxygenase [Streptomyces sp. JJ36]|uniref:FAD-dependent monooxygenase n=1 Tax=Streptomyces sp. JJ36 TaxID=2736645 RepID=UPI001F000E20|nr:FAD-dependent monooxygenase [Streptomyces sp. JJ36]MCF6522533.1 FAD-dependent monooxygenase [Streptomyces sp. JJ36]
MNTRPTVLVAGAGIGGLTAALAARRQGFPVTVFERRTSLRVETSGTGVTIWSNATTALSALGLRDRILRAGVPIRESRLVTERDVPVLHTPVQRYTAPGSTPGVTIARGALARVLTDACEDAGVRIRFSADITRHRVDGDRVTVRLDDGTEVRGGVLVGADGLRSRTAARLLGDTEPVYTGVTTYRGVSDTDCGVPPGTVHLFQGRHGVNGGAWHIGNGQVTWTVGHPAPPGGQDVPGRRRARILELVEGFQGPPQCLVRHTPEDRLLRTDLYYSNWYDKWGEGPVTLLGDAAHAVTTVLGQGACQAVEDAVVLGDELGAAPHDPVGALRSYEEARRERVRSVRETIFRVASAPRVDNRLLRPLFLRLTRYFATRNQEAMWRGLQQPPHLRATPAPDAVVQP